jgi:putative hydrolase of the HAD superfamily
MEPFSAMLFDVYGTLLISGAGEIGLNQWPIERMDDVQGLLTRYAIAHTPQSLLDEWVKTIDKTHGILQQQGIDFPEVDIVKVWRQVLGWDDLPMLSDWALEFELVVNPVYPMPGLEELLLACTTRKMPMGIISNAQYYTVDVLERFLGATLGRRGFDQRLLFFSWREGYAKPSSVMFRRAKTVLADMGIPATSVLVVGNDMQNDILPAASVGFMTALFAGDRRSLRLRESDNRCKALSPDLIITDLGQLIAGTGNY